MHYFSKPEAQNIRHPITGESVPLTFDEFLRDLVWPHPYWRQTKDALEAMRRMRQEFSSNVGELSLTDEDHEKLLSQVKALDLTQRTAIVDAVAEFTYALMCTRTKLISD